MFLVEVSPGREVVYQSVEELGAAIARREIDGHARIYHRATATWLSITLHPQYKARVAAWLDEPLPPLARSNWTFLPGGPESVATRSAGGTASGGQAGSPGSRSGEKPHSVGGRNWRRIALPLRSLRQIFHR